jgi:outer membrane protein assembly factor BamB
MSFVHRSGGPARGWRADPPTRAAFLVFLALALAACSSGGGSGGDLGPTAPWSQFRRNTANSGQGSGIVASNPGTFRFAPLDLAAYGGTTLSTPTIGLDDTMYVGTGAGLLALTTEGAVRWFFDRCEQPTGSVPVGPVNSSPTVTVEGDVVFGSDAGFVFAVHDDDTAFTCLWAVQVAAQTGIRSSPLVQIDPVDGNITAVVIGTGDGRVEVLNHDGTRRWQFPVGTAPLTASPAAGLDGSVYITAPDGFLYALDSVGRQRWRAPLDGAATSAALLPSAAVNVATASGTVYAITADRLAALQLDGTPKWERTLGAPSFGSPAYALQFVEDRADPTPGGSPTATPSGTPTPAIKQDVLVYAVDQRGTVYGVRDSDGTLEADPPFDTGASEVQTSPVVSSDLFVVFGTTGGRLHAWTITGEKPAAADAWPIDLGEQTGRVLAVRSSPSIDRDGTVYVTGDDGFLYGIGGATVTATSRPTRTPTPSSPPTATPTVQAGAV